MNIFAYMDESGTFDYLHDQWFSYGGVLLVDATSTRLNDAKRKYLALEQQLRPHLKSNKDEVKAAFLDFKSRYRMWRSIPGFGLYRFGGLIRLSYVHEYIWTCKANKQRYLDYVAKRTLKNALTSLNGLAFNLSDVRYLKVFSDEHSTKTSGRYNFQESIDTEFRYGCYNPDSGAAFAPILNPTMCKPIYVEYVDSTSEPLVRAADFVANWCRAAYRDGKDSAISGIRSSVPFIELP